MKKVIMYTSVLVCIISFSLSCKKSAEETPKIVTSSNVSFVKDSAVSIQVIVPGKTNVMLGKGLFFTGPKRLMITGVSYNLSYSGGATASKLIGLPQVTINDSTGKTIFSATSAAPQPAVYPNLSVGAGQIFTILLVAPKTDTDIPDGATITTAITVYYSYVNDNNVTVNASQGITGQTINFQKTATGSLVVTVNPVTAPKVITFGLPSQTISGTFTSVGAPVTLQSLRIGVLDSNFVGVINLYVNGFPQGVYTKTGVHSLVVPITINGTVTYSIDIAPTASAVNALLQTTVSEVTYLDAGGTKKMDPGSYVGGVVYGFFSVPTVRRNTITNTTIIDGQQREFVNVSLSSDTYKQFTVAFRFVDNVNTNADSMRIDSMQLLINGSPVAVNFSVGSVNKKYITKRDSLVIMTFATGVSELVLQSTSTLSLVGIPKYFGKNNGNGLQVQFLTDATPPPVGYNKLFNVNGLGPVTIGATGSATVLPYMIWSTNAAGVAHTALPGYSSSDWCTGWVINPLAPQTLYVQ